MYYRDSKLGKLKIIKEVKDIPQEFSKPSPDLEVKSNPVRPKSTFKFGKPKEKKPELSPVKSKGYCKHGVSLEFGFCKHGCTK